VSAAGLLPHHNAHVTTRSVLWTPLGQGLPLATDGMLHEAQATMRCRHVTDRCYEPTSPAYPRPCPTRIAGQEGCACTGPECVAACRRTTPRDSAACLIHYSGDNQEDATNSRPARDVYGYRSYT
jgi:hypothetical protein